MSIEEEIFKSSKVDFEKLINYGFKKDNDEYKFSKKILNDTFQVNLFITKEGMVRGKIYDLTFHDEYLNFRLKNTHSSFVHQVQQEYIKILEDIRKNCFITNKFMFEQTNRIAKAICKKYMDSPKFKWEKFPNYAVFENKETSKWYAIIMNIALNKLEGKDEKEVEIINVKLETQEIARLSNKEGFYPAYHMNKKNWITMLLNDTLKDEEILDLVHKSYNSTKK